MSAYYSIKRWLVEPLREAIRLLMANHHQHSGPYLDDLEDLFVKDQVMTIDLDFHGDGWDHMLKSYYRTTRFMYQPVTFKYNRFTIPNVAVRLKGLSSLNLNISEHRPPTTFELGGFNLPVPYFLWSQMKKPLKINFTKYGGREFLGYRSIGLSNNLLDPSYLRERICFMLLKESGLLYCETSSVNLTVDGRHLGVFTMVENVDKSYIRKHFGSAKGDLYKANYKTFLEWKGNDPELYIEDKEGDSHQRGMLDPKLNESGDHGAVIKFIDFINNASDEEFRESIGERFGAEDFIKIAALNNVTGNIDDYVCWGNNYFLYKKAKKDRWIFIPWDCSTSFCIETNFNIRDPLDNHRAKMWPNRRPLFQRLFAIPEYKNAYYRFMREFITESFHPEILIPRIEQLWNDTRDSAKNDVSSLQEYPEFLESVKREPPFKKLRRMIGVPDGLIIQSLPYFVRERHGFVDEELKNLGY